MNFIASLLLLTALTIQSPVLILKSGQRIAVDGPMQLQNGIVLFHAGKTLYSIPADEVDLDATRAAAPSITVVASEEPKNLRVTPAERERLLRELEQNHAGTAASSEQMSIPPSPERPRTETSTSTDEEWSWKNRARAYEEDVRRARENLDLLRQRAAELRSQISGFISQGFKPSQFTFQTTLLADIEEQIPRAELEVTRAERAYQLFLEEARRRGVLPGWLR